MGVLKKSKKNYSIYLNFLKEINKIKEIILLGRCPDVRTQGLVFTSTTDKNYSIL